MGWNFCCPSNQYPAWYRADVALPGHTCPHWSDIDLVYKYPLALIIWENTQSGIQHTCINTCLVMSFMGYMHIYGQVCGWSFCWCQNPPLMPTWCYYRQTGKPWEKRNTRKSTVPFHSICWTCGFFQFFKNLRFEKWLLPGSAKIGCDTWQTNWIK